MQRASQLGQLLQCGCAVIGGQLYGVGGCLQQLRTPEGRAAELEQQLLRIVQVLQAEELCRWGQGVMSLVNA